MKRLISVFLVAILLITMSACGNDLPAPGDTPSDSMKIVLNDKVLDVYTMHYGATEEFAIIPLTAFLRSIGAKYANSPINEYGIQCYSFMGKRYAFVGDMHLFILEDDYLALLEELDREGKVLDKDVASTCGLLPKSESKILEEYGDSEGRSQILVDHISLMNALRESGVDITIDYDYPTRTITVSLI